jgi:hypothetical protein
MLMMGDARAFGQPDRYAPGCAPSSGALPDLARPWQHERETMANRPGGPGGAAPSRRLHPTHRAPKYFFLIILPDIQDMQGI